MNPNLMVNDQTDMGRTGWKHLETLRSVPGPDDLSIGHLGSPCQAKRESKERAAAARCHLRWQMESEVGNAIKTRFYTSQPGNGFDGDS